MVTVGYEKKYEKKTAPQLVRPHVHRAGCRRGTAGGEAGGGEAGGGQAGGGQAGSGEAGGGEAGGGQAGSDEAGGCEDETAPPLYVRDGALPPRGASPILTQLDGSLASDLAADEAGADASGAANSPRCEIQQRPARGEDGPPHSASPGADAPAGAAATPVKHDGWRARARQQQ